MIRALETSLSAYAACGENLARHAEGLRSQRADADPTRNLVGMMADARAAQANLVAARIAEEVGDSLMHVIA
jgi:hypothetical protein